MPHPIKISPQEALVRTIEQATAPRTGERVTIEGNKLRPLSGSQG